MEDFIGLILVAIFYILSASSKKNKKKKQRKQTNQLEEVEQALKKAIQTAKQNERVRGAEQAKARESAHHPDTAAVAHAAQAASCESDRLHLHQVTQAQMNEAEEGEDPCHKGGETAPDTQDEGHAYEEDEAVGENAYAQELLRGVIVSEILTRPNQRRTMLKNRWRA